VAGVVPPVRASLARGRDHRRDEHQQVDRQPLAHERRRVAPERVGHHDELGAVADGVDHRVRVLGQPGRLVLAREIHRHHIVPPFAQLGGHELPARGHVARAVDQHVCGHRRLRGF
jgi:hypothetical protein